MTSYLNAMRKSATFNGRARRTEFWLFMLIVFVGIIVGAVLDGALGGVLIFAGVLNN